MGFIYTEVAVLVLFIVLLAVFGPKLKFVRSRRPAVRYAILLLIFVVGAPLVALVVLVVSVLVVLIISGGYGYYPPISLPEDRAAIVETREAWGHTQSAREAATQTASTATANARATTESAYVVLAIQRAQLDGHRERSNDHSDGAWETLQDNIPAEFVETSDRHLQSGTSYTYRVIALNEWSESAPSDPYTLHVP